MIIAMIVICLWNMNSLGTSLYRNTCARKYKRSHKLLFPRDDLDVFSVHTKNLHCNLSETSSEFTLGVEFEFVIMISILHSNLRTHMLKFIICDYVKHSSF